MNKARHALLLTLLLSVGLVQATAADTLVIQSGSDVPTLDPGATYEGISGSLVDNIYENLLTYKDNSLTQLVPMLATSWQVGNKGKTYTFTLRKNVKFHSGAPFTCQDAEYTYERNLVTNNSGSSNWFISEPLLGTQSNGYEDKTITWERIDRAVECNNAGQLVFNLIKVDPAFLAKLAYTGQTIIEKGYTIKLGEWSGTEKDWKSWIGKDLTDSKLSKAPNGTGAYKLARRDTGSYTFQAFDGYWGKKPSIKTVIRQKVTDASAREQAFLRGDADFIDGNGRTSDESRIKGKPGVTWLDDLPNVTVAAIFMNEMIRDVGQLGSGKLDGNGIPRNFFSDVNVRKAFSYAFNYDEFIRDFLSGKGRQRTMLLPESFIGYNPKLPTYKYDPAQARAYFQKAWGGEVWNKGFTINVPYSTRPLSSKTGLELLKKNIEALNPKFHINLQFKEWSDLQDSSRKGQEAIVLLQWVADYADPDNFMYTFYASDGFYAPRSNYRDERADQWLRAARTSLIFNERTYYYSGVGQRAYDFAPYIYLPALSNYYFFRSNIKGISEATSNPMLNTVVGVRWVDMSKN